MEVEDGLFPGAANSDRSGPHALTRIYCYLGPWTHNPGTWFPHALTTWWLLGPWTCYCHRHPLTTHLRAAPLTGSLNMLQPVDTLRTKNKLPGVSETWIGQQEKLSPNLFANQTNQAFILISSDPNNFNLGVCEKACLVLLICHCSLFIYLSANTHPR